MKSAVEELAETIDLHAAVGGNLKAALTAAERANDAASFVSLVSLMHTFSSSTNESCSKVQEGLEALKAASERQSGVARTLRRQSRPAPPAPPEDSPAAASQDVEALPVDPDSQRSNDTGVHSLAAQYTGANSGAPAMLTPPPKDRVGRKRRYQEPTAAASSQEDAPLIDLGRLQLRRSLVAFHLKTTGLNTKSDRIVEFVAVRVEPDGTSTTLRHRVHPGQPMPAAAAAVNSITEADLKVAPEFPEVAMDIWRFFEGADILGYNALAFHVPLLAAEFARTAVISSATASDAEDDFDFQFPPTGACVLDPLVLYLRRQKYSLAAAHRHFCGAAPQDGQQTTFASKATAALQVLVGLVNYFPELPSAVPALHHLCNEPEERPSFEWVNGQPFFRFGRHKGELLSVVVASQGSYLGWMLGQDFGQKTDGIVARALQGDFSQPAEKTA